MIAGIIAGCVVLAGAVGGAIYMSMRSNSDATASSNPNKPGAAAANPNVPMLTFTFDWPTSERRGATLMVNGDLKAIPESGPVEIKLPRATDQYTFELQRQGYRAIKFSRPLVDNDSYIVKGWESESQGIEFEQDYAAAKKAAADQHKNVLIVFDASDAKASSFHSSRFHESVLSSPEFAERAEKEYVCVYIDNPEKDEAKKNVHNLAQNRKVTGDFEIKVFPTVVVTDSARPAVRRDGRLHDRRNQPFSQAHGQVAARQPQPLRASGQSERQQRLGNDSAKRIDFLQLNGLDRFYAGTVKSLSQKLPNGDREVSERDFEFWRTRLAMAMSNPDNVKKEVEEFDRWKATRSFAKNPDAGAALDAMAALVLSARRRQGSREEEGQ